MKQVIAVDADDVLGNENHAMMRFINKRYGHTHSPEDYNVAGEYGPYWWNIWEVDEAEGKKRYDEFVQAKLREEVTLEPLPYALDVLKGLKSSYDLVVVTSRSGILFDVTERWLQKHFLDIFTDVHFVELWNETEKVSKARICNEVGARYLIDDHAAHCTLAQEADVQALLFGDYGWNRHVRLPQGIRRVQDWKAVKEYFNAR